MSLVQTSETSYVAKIKVTGMKFNKGSMDNGTAYDSTKVYAETRFDETKGNARGYATTEYTLGKSEEYAKYAHLPLPLVFEVEMENVTNGKNRSTIILQMIPVGLPKSAPSAGKPAGA